MPMKNDDFEVIEETVSDFDYFYDDEEVSKRNRGVIIKYRIVSIGFIVIVLMFLLTLLGISRMKIYGTKNVLTKDEINYIETKNVCDEVIKGVQTFYLCDKVIKDEQTFYICDTDCDYYKAVSAMYGGDGTKLDVDSFYVKTYGTNSFEGWSETLASYSESLSKVTLPKKKDLSDLVYALEDVVNGEIYLIEQVYENYDNIISGNYDLTSTEDNLNYYFQTLSSIQASRLE